MDVTEALLDSWDRQCRIVDALATRIDENNRHLKPSEDGWPLLQQLAHIHGTRRFWLTQVDPERAGTLPRTMVDWNQAIEDLDAIKSALDQSAKAVREAVGELIRAGNGPVSGPNGKYENPVLYLQHMIWHEGWHVGLILLALRLGGQEPPEEWEEENVWGQWRTEIW